MMYNESMTKLTLENIPKIIDVSAVRTDVSQQEVDELAAVANHFNFICAFVMPYWTPRLIAQLKSNSSVMVGGVAGFPSGAEESDSKALMASKLIGYGCHEIDMVINIGALKSKDYKTVQADIESVRKACGDIPLKVIMEISYLSDLEIIEGCRIAADAGAAFVKTGTGWASRAATVDVIELMVKAVNGKCAVKAAGGVRSLDQVIEMYEAGCSRFGIGVKSAISILKEAAEREEKPFDFSLKSADHLTEVY